MGPTGMDSVTANHGGNRPACLHSASADSPHETETAKK